tara:strand:+ start:2338 stop:3411 length:1074 start_codon:yes stop_codon:yes gene_type:complete
MATFEAHIEGLTQIDITTSSAPTQDELTEFLQEALVDVVNKIVQYKPQEAFKFAAESEAADDNGITVTGKVLSVVREHDSASIVRPCTPIPPELKYEATDTESLYYRSKFNPGFFLSNGKIFVRPAAAGSNNDMKVSQISYDIGGSGLVHSDNYNQGAVSNFPTEYEYLIAMYAGAKTCQAAASDIQENMPTEPNAPDIPIFENDDFEIPSLPVISVPRLDFSFSSIDSYLKDEDLDASDKAFTRFDKQIEVFKQKLSQDEKFNEKNLDVFSKELDKLIKDADRNLQIQLGEYKSLNEKYQVDVSLYTTQLSEKVTKYKWYTEQYVNLMTQYTSSIMGLAQPKAKGDKPKQKERRSN